MRLFKLAVGGGAAVAMLATAGVAAAQPTRSVSALPSANALVTTKDFRAATPLKRKSSQSDDGIPAVGYVAAAVVAAAIVTAAVTSSNDNKTTGNPASPG